MERKRSAAARAKTRPLKRGLCLDHSKRGDERGWRSSAWACAIASEKAPEKDAENCFDCARMRRVASGHRRSLIPRVIPSARRY